MQTYGQMQSGKWLGVQRLRQGFETHTQEYMGIYKPTDTHSDIQTYRLTIIVFNKFRH